AAKADRAGGCMRFDMADRDVPLDNPLFRSNSQAFPAKGNFRLTAGFREDFNIGPRDAAAPARAQNLEHRFLGGKPTGQMFKITLFAARTVLALLEGIDAI